MCGGSAWRQPSRGWMIADRTTSRRMSPTPGRTLLAISMPHVLHVGWNSTCPTWVWRGVGLELFVIGIRIITVYGQRDLLIAACIDMFAWASCQITANAPADMESLTKLGGSGKKRLWDFRQWVEKASSNEDYFSRTPQTLSPSPMVLMIHVIPSENRHISLRLTHEPSPRVSPPKSPASGAAREIGVPARPLRLRAR